MAKILAKKRILCELFCSHFICKSNNINGKILWVRQIFMERHLKEEFHVLIKELKLFGRELFFQADSRYS